MFTTILFAIMHLSFLMNNQSDALPIEKASFSIIESIKNPSKDSLKTFLGEELFSYLQQMDTAKIVRLEEWKLDTTDNSFYGYKILEQKDTILQEHLDSLTMVLLQKETYIINEIAKRCEFSPNIGLEFEKANKKIAILIAYNCDVLQILVNNKERIKEDCDKAHHKLVEFGNSIFPNAFDNYLEPSH